MHRFSLALQKRHLATLRANAELESISRVALASAQLYLLEPRNAAKNQIRWAGTSKPPDIRSHHGKVRGEMSRIEHNCQPLGKQDGPAMRGKSIRRSYGEWRRPVDFSLLPRCVKAKMMKISLVSEALRDRV